MHSHEIIEDSTEKKTKEDLMWDESAAANQKFYEFLKAGQTQEFYDSVPQEKREAATRKYDVLKIVCMDERINESDVNAVVVRDGGGGILRNSNIAEDIQKIIESPAQIAADYIKLIKKLGIKKVIVTSHENCGACSLSRKNDEQQKKYYSELIDAIKNGAQKEGLNLEVTSDYISAKPNHNPEGRKLAGIHDARGVYYANVEAVFNPQKITDLFSGFVVSRGMFDGGSAPKGYQTSYPKANVKVALDLAFGHGFGHRFSADQPFVLMAVGSDVASRDMAIAELEETKEKFITSQITSEKYKSLNESPYDRAYYEQAIVVVGIVEPLAA